MKNSAFVICSAMLISAAPAFAWDGYDMGSGSSVEIDKGTLVRPGETIEYYDYGSGDYKNSDVMEMHEAPGGNIEIEVHDNRTGQISILEMEKPDRHGR